MEFLTIDALDYETALKEARALYGSLVRVHTRKDYTAKKGLRRERRCAITFYLVREQEPAEQEPQVAIEQPEPRAKLQDPVGDQQLFIAELLQANDFTDEYVDLAIKALAEDPKDASNEELQMRLLEYIIESVSINHELYAHPQHYFVLLGPTGVGKTTTLVKMAMLYGMIVQESSPMKVALLSLDSYRTGASNQIEQFSKDLGLDLYHAHSEEELSRLLKKLDAYSLVLVDTMGKSANQGELSLHLKSLLTVLPQERCTYSLAVSASHKSRDLKRFVSLFSSYPLQSLVVTKLDETEDIGNILSVSKETGLPLLFFTNGQKVPENLLKATNEVILSYLKGFSLDFSTLGDSQISPLL